jgi:hypothetical protein
MLLLKTLTKKLRLMLLLMLQLMTRSKLTSRRMEKRTLRKEKSQKMLVLSKRKSMTVTKKMKLETKRDLLASSLMTQKM